MVAAGDDGLGTLTHSSRAQTPGQKLQKLKTLDVGKLTRASDQQKRGFILEMGAVRLAGLGISPSGLKLEPAPCHQESQ